MTRSLKLRFLAGMLVLVGPLGCTVWRADDQVLLAPIPERQPVQIHTGTEQVVAHSVRVDSTTLSYTLKIAPTDCDSCRRTIPLATVDSVRTSHFSPVRTLILVGSLIGVTAWAVAGSGANDY